MFAAHRARRIVFFTAHPFRHSGAAALGACVWWWFRNINIFVLPSKRHFWTPLSQFGRLLACWYHFKTLLWRAKNDDPSQPKFSFLIFNLDFFLFLLLRFLGMSQLIRSLLNDPLRCGLVFWSLLGGYFFRPLSVEIVVFVTWIVFVFFSKT